MGVREKLGREFEVLAPTAGPAATSDVVNMRGSDGARVVFNAGAGVTAATFQAEGSPNGKDRWYPMGPAVVLNSAGTRTLWLGEPNSFIRVQVSGVAGGSVDVGVQRFD